MTAMDDAPRQPPADREEMARQLKANMRQRRPHYFRTLGVLLGIFVAALGLAAWLFWPRPSLPPLNLLACDQIAVPGETVRMEAWLAPKDPRVSIPDLGGLDISFEPLLAPGRPGAPLPEVKSRSSANGHVKASITAPGGEEIIEYRISHTSPLPGQRTEDRARLFVCKPETRLLLVEVAAVADAPADAWYGSDLGDVRARPSADEALRKARSKNYQIVYIAAGATLPMPYRLMRAWVESKSQEQSPFPDGPVLARLPEVDWVLTFMEMKRRWSGALVAVAKDPRLAEALRDAGVTTFVLGEAGDVPAGCQRLATWQHLSEKIPKK